MWSFDAGVMNGRRHLGHFTLFLSHEIPAETPLGEYQYWVKVDEDLPIYESPVRFGLDPDRYYLYKNTFRFTVVEGASFRF